MKISDVKLNNGQDMPSIGFGVWQLKDREECVNAVSTAFEAGYRHVDSAQIYGNEEFVGEAVKKSTLPRDEVFITTKISIYNFLRVNKSFDESLRKLDMEYVDLLLLHYPVTGARKKAWVDLEKLNEAGKASSIGVSNYTIRHLTQLLEHAHVKPAVNQVEIHVFLQQPELIKFCQDNDIVVQAYSPLVHGEGMNDPTLTKIAQKHDKTVAQIMLRWCIQAGTVPLPKSATAYRIKENIDIFDFELDNDDMKQIKELDRDYRTCWDPTRTP